MHWGWYWNVKRGHTPKARCSWQRFSTIDSFSMFKNTALLNMIKQSKDRISLTIPEYNLTAILNDDDSLAVQFDGGSYVILVEKKSCNFGGFYYFFRCPGCNARMRKLYCIQGRYLCRKCGNLAYHCQKLRTSERYALMRCKVKDTLQNKGGSLNKRPPRMQEHTFQKMRQKYVTYDEKSFDALNNELGLWFGYEGDCYSPPADMFDAYVPMNNTYQCMQQV